MWGRERGDTRNSRGECRDTNPHRFFREGKTHTRIRHSPFCRCSWRRRFSFVRSSICCVGKERKDVNKEGGKGNGRYPGSLLIMPKDSPSETVQVLLRRPRTELSVPGTEFRPPKERSREEERTRIGGDARNEEDWRKILGRDLSTTHTAAENLFQYPQHHSTVTASLVSSRGGDSSRPSFLLLRLGRGFGYRGSPREREGIIILPQHQMQSWTHPIEANIRRWIRK